MLDDVSMLMNRSGRELPTLEDALAKGFASMKAEDESVVDEVPQEQLVQTKPEEPVVAPDYSKPTQAVERRTSFTVAQTSSNTTLQPSEASVQPKVAVEILEKPSSTLGDDFDVQW